MVVSVMLSRHVRVRGKRITCVVAGVEARPKKAPFLL